MPYGAIYIAHNPRDGDNIFKVGKTERTVDDRMKQLTSSTSNLGTYVVHAYFVVYDIDAAEEACHRALRRYRVQDNREFYELFLSRLVRIVAEQVKQYAARDFVPVIESDDSPSTRELSASEMLKSARERRNAIDNLWRQALVSTILTMSDWLILIRDKALKVAAELKDEKIMRWEIPEFIDPNETITHFMTVCSVTFFCLFSKKPLELWKSGVRGGNHGTLDLSRVIGTPEVRDSTLGDKQVQFVRWKEPDDGQIGRFQLIAHIENGRPDDREKGIKPLPKVTVRANRISYDDYHENFKEYGKAKS